VSTKPNGPPPGWLRRWEDLHVVVQVAVVLPVTVLVLWFVHVVFLNQPLGRGLSYGLFWGALATAAIVGASRSEKARRGR
jgi:hypothetical protein